MRAIRSPITIALLLAWAWSASGEVRTWTEVTGKYKYEAEFVSLEAGVVKLRLPDGRVSSIPIEKLSEADRAIIAAKVKAGGAGPPVGFAESPRPRKHSETAKHFSELLKRPGAKDKMLALEGLGKIRIESLDRAQQAEGLAMLARIEGFGDHEAWDEASAAIARHYTQDLDWEKAEKAWFEYVADKHTSRYAAEAWCSLGFAREKLAGDDKEKLLGAVSAYLRCFAKYKAQVRYSSVAWRRTAEIERRRGEVEKASKLIDLMVAELGGLAEITDPEKRTDDVKWAQIELNKARALQKAWSD